MLACEARNGQRCTDWGSRQRRRASAIFAALLSSWQWEQAVDGPGLGAEVIECKHGGAGQLHSCPRNRDAGCSAGVKTGVFEYGCCMRDTIAAKRRVYLWACVQVRKSNVCVCVCVCVCPTRHQVGVRWQRASAVCLQHRRLPDNEAAMLFTEAKAAYRDTATRGHLPAHWHARRAGVIACAIFTMHVPTL